MTQTSNPASAVTTKIQTETIFDAPDAPHGAGWIATAAALFVLYFWARGKWSKSGVDNANASAQKDMLATAIKERNAAMASAEKAWSMRTEDAKRIGKLSADVEHLTAENRALRQEMQLLREVLLNVLPPDIADRIRKSALSASALQHVVAEAIPHQPGVEHDITNSSAAA